MGKNIVVKIVAIAAMLAIAFAMTACAESKFAVDSGENDVHAVAENGASGSATGHITIEPEHGLCINHIVTKGSFHVKAVDEQGTVVFDDDLTDNIADFVPVTGEIDLFITANNATGTIDIIAYDVEAQAQADAGLEELMSRASIDSAQVPRS